MYFVQVVLLLKPQNMCTQTKMFLTLAVLFLSSASGSDTSTQSATPEPDKSKPKKNRCFTCHKKVGLTGKRHLFQQLVKATKCSLFLNQYLEFILCTSPISLPKYFIHQWHHQQTDDLFFVNIYSVLKYESLSDKDEKKEETPVSSFAAFMGIHM